MTHATVRTSAGVEVVIRPARAENHRDLHRAFAAVVLASEGYPHESGPLAYDDFAAYWLEDKSLVVAAHVGLELAGSYHLNPNFLGRLEGNPARRLYERFGFEVVGRIPAAVDGQAGIVYWRSLR